MNRTSAIRPILIVENEENDTFFIKRAIEKAAIRNPIQVVESAQEALLYLKGEAPFTDRIRYPLPSLVLLDLKLRGLDGTAVLEWIRQQSPFPLLPVIVLSSSELSLDVNTAYRCGANSYVVKPADPSDLVLIMRDCANWWLKHNIAPM